MFGELSKPTSAYFAVEGNIGCGKSSFLDVLKARVPELQWIEEPVK
jgi:deoxyadenosine/deoxycytidine kinase